MYYSDDRPLQFLAGPYATENEAIVASGAYEADHPEFRTKTFVWTCRAGRETSDLRYDASSGQPVIPPLMRPLAEGTVAGMRVDV